MSDQSYRLATCADADGEPCAAVVIDDQVINVVDALTGKTEKKIAASLTTVLTILSRWDAVHPLLKNFARMVRAGQWSGASRELPTVQFLAPILYPGAIFCAGANYKDHVEEMSKALNLPAEPDPHELGLKPWHFLKASASCVRGTGSRIVLPEYSQKVDWEAEIAVVIGRECRHVSVDKALDYVAGVSIVNDLSARDHLRRQGVAPDSPFRYDWVSQKCFDGALPFGPWICPMEEIADLGNLRIRLWVNEQLMQDSSSSNLIFSVAEQISHLSSRLTLRPGDVIATGTPAGCGAAHGRFLRPGDRVSVWVENIGLLINEFEGAA
jgi:2-keto-4-pentenoate hydratase/2-oxohepta-3-ene-1,7-dioic acid hydratase in catechol pathway